MKRVLIMFAVIVALSPLGVLAQLPVATDACAQAQMDAQADVNETLWFFAGCLPPASGGCLLGLWGVGIGAVTSLGVIGFSSFIEPSPPATRLLGQPPDYVAIYTDCYKDKAKSIQTSAAIKGCITYAALWGAYYLFSYIFYSAAAAPYY